MNGPRGGARQCGFDCGWGAAGIQEEEGKGTDASQWVAR